MLCLFADLWEKVLCFVNLCFKLKKKQTCYALNLLQLPHGSLRQHRTIINSKVGCTFKSSRSSLIVAVPITTLNSSLPLPKFTTPSTLIHSADGESSSVKYKQRQQHQRWSTLISLVQLFCSYICWHKRFFCLIDYQQRPKQTNVDARARSTREIQRTETKNSQLSRDTKQTTYGESWLKIPPNGKAATNQRESSGKKQLANEVKSTKCVKSNINIRMYIKREANVLGGGGDECRSATFPHFFC